MAIIARTWGLIAAALIALALLVATRSTARVAIRVTGPTELAELLSIDIWSRRPFDVVVPSDALASLDAAGVAYEVLVPDIDAVAADEHARLQSSAASGDFFDDFRDFAAISAHLRELGPVVSIGTSVEGRPILALMLGHGPRTMLVDGTLHAREWIAAMTATCVADRLARGSDAATRDFLDRNTIWIVPVANPDGYTYSWTDNRYWRKNRHGTYGVDLNRNFSVAWGESGSSKNERAETYRGTAPFSEPESAALRDFATHERIAAHVDFHSYGQLVLYPWNHTKTPPADRDRLAAIGDRVASAIYAQHQSRYRLQTGADLYPAAGTATDWAYGTLGALSYTIELRPKGGSGFVLPPEQIKPTCDEGLAAVLALGRD
jgi:murein tripeptide amidase MpaA